MLAETDRESRFDLILPGSGMFWMRKLRVGFNAVLKKATGLTALESLYRRVRSAPGESCVADKIISNLGIALEVTEGALKRIPRTGPLVVVANHPFGGVEAAALASLLCSVRPDVKFLANHMLLRAPELNELILPVDPFQRGDSVRSNLTTMRKAILWVRSGGLLAIFPAGEVAHYQISKGQVTDPCWQPSVGHLIRTLKAPVVPICFPGRNSWLFQLAGLIHPRLRTALLVREFLNKRGCILTPRIGHPIAAVRLDGLTSNEEMIHYLRHRTYLLAVQEDRGEELHPEGPSTPVVPPSPREVLWREVRMLPREQKLCGGGKLDVYYALYDQIPGLMQEVGRLREVTFRLAGEGSGKAADLDEFDRSYLHLFVWNRQEGELVGAYRLGLSDQILPRYGKEGFYTTCLFEYPKSLIAAISPAIELGRSFVRVEYQRSYLPLLLLWKGIGNFLLQKPWYRCLFGAVSMSSRYKRLSRELLVAHLSHNYAWAEFSRLVRGRNPMRLAGGNGDLPKGLSLKISGLEELSEIISDLEADGKGVPVLFQKYVELGGRFLAFHRDGDFNDTLDGLVLVDLPQSNRRLLEFYMGRGGAAYYLSHHERECRGRKEWSDSGGLPPQPARGWQPAAAS